MSRKYFEILSLTGEIIRDTIKDYLNYKKAQRVLWEYHKKLISGTSCGIANQHELEAIVIVSEYEKIQDNKREMKIRIKNSKKTA